MATVSADPFFVVVCLMIVPLSQEAPITVEIGMFSQYVLLTDSINADR